jgi:folate-binding Fe-S cluster repair protein YgfZ
MGQEVMMRIHSRGQVNRIWMGLYTDALVRPGDTIKHRNRADAGVVTSAFDSPDYGFIAAAYIRRESAYEGEQVTVVTAEGEVGAELLQMPILRVG